MSSPAVSPEISTEYDNDASATVDEQFGTTVIDGEPTTLVPALAPEQFAVYFPESK